jgi:hypothetical protein
MVNSPRPALPSFTAVPFIYYYRGLKSSSLACNVEGLVHPPLHIGRRQLYLRALQQIIILRRIIGGPYRRLFGHVVRAFDLVLWGLFVNVGIMCIYRRPLATSSLVSQLLYMTRRISQPFF